MNNYTNPLKTFLGSITWTYIGDTFFGLWIYRTAVFWLITLMCLKKSIVTTYPYHTFRNYIYFLCSFNFLSNREKLMICHFLILFLSVNIEKILLHIDLIVKLIFHVNNILCFFIIVVILILFMLWQIWKFYLRKSLVQIFHILISHSSFLLFLMQEKS